ncbi:60S ribosomal protein L36 [Fusarium oxysporum f. sp. albedinis]|nr:60S ribosomal protein L36 [Fusarium oxysporum f. sp. albedinis]
MIDGCFNQLVERKLAKKAHRQFHILGVSAAKQDVVDSAMVVSSFDLCILAIGVWALVGTKTKDPDSSSIRRSYRIM